MHPVNDATPVQTRHTLSGTATHSVAPLLAFQEFLSALEDSGSVCPAEG